MGGLGGSGRGVGLGLVGAAYPDCTVMCIVSNMIVRDLRLATRSSDDALRGASTARAEKTRFFASVVKTLARASSSDKTSAYSSKPMLCTPLRTQRRPDIQVYRPIKTRLHKGTQRPQQQGCTGPTQPSTSLASGVGMMRCDLIRSNNRCHGLRGHVAGDATTFRRTRDGRRDGRRDDASVRRQNVRERQEPRRAARKR